LRQLIDNGANTTQNVPPTPGQWAAPLRHRFGVLFEELNVNASWDLPPRWLIEPTALQCLTMTRVVEEALTNIVKHSRARNVSIKLHLPDAHQLVLHVIDDGVGFDVATVQAESLGVGMRSMKVRLERVHGGLQIQSARGATTLRAFMRLGEIRECNIELPRMRSGNAASTLNAAS